eukprot:TRINITY_DN800_c0_g2_i3.p1 TRINITY_DN800_c0_g2~~TRINITY_DN800_c0_g2_i3.p1  ORF type:complete len:334 (-),score=75.64 TRINITY_DN800_c0_g2_i3:1241-2242(-)
MKFAKDSQMLFISEPHDALICPLHYDVYDDPVVLPCGHTFCAECVERFSQIRRECPIDRTNFHPLQLVPNRSIADQVDQLLVHCPNGVQTIYLEGFPILDADQNGCPHVTTLANLPHHLQTCDVESISPSSQTTSSTPRNRQHQHQHQEERACPHAQLGCRFVGSNQATIAHRLNDCPYSAIKAQLLQDSKRIQLLKSKNAAQEAEIRALRHHVQAQVTGQRAPSNTRTSQATPRTFTSQEPSFFEHPFFFEVTQAVRETASFVAEKVSHAAVAIQSVFEETEQEKAAKEEMRLREKAQLEARLAALQEENKRLQMPRQHLPTQLDSLDSLVE